MKNIWKSLFVVLLLLNISFVFWLYYSLTSSDEAKTLENRKGNTDAIPLSIRTNKSDLNTIINQYLRNEKKGAIDYQIELDDYVNLYGTLPIFNQKMNMKVAFEPVALENGDLILQEKELTIGKLKLPPETALKFVKDRYQIPEWVTIQHDKERVYLDLQKLKLKSDMQVSVNEFDLNDDRIIFTLHVPIEKGVSK
ncbi:YpmS family protein [Bacillus sp. T3]|uniref:YpmS family protein n=1 Tax=Bacillus sp. T3 TaxID=467262 RepID=UPI002981C3AE|nr:YpmS family protein [Bacillus sp. T3]